MTEPATLSMEQVSKILISKITPLSSAKIVFSGFVLPDEFGGSDGLEYGDIALAKSQGLSAGAADMGKNFVINAIEDLFSGDFEESIPSDTRFLLSQEGESNFILTALESSEN
ncbi:MAG: hypothetical protein ACE5FY_07440 [Nitrospiria bacterium]